MDDLIDQFIFSICFNLFFPYPTFALAFCHNPHYYYVIISHEYHFINTIHNHKIGWTYLVKLLLSVTKRNGNNSIAISMHRIVFSALNVLILIVKSYTIHYLR